MKHVLGLINLYEPAELVQELTGHRPLAAVPFGGRYRLIDFILSNMVNSGIRNIGVLTYTNYRSLMDHLRSGKEWDLARKHQGLFMLPSNQNPNLPYSPKGEGDIEQIYAHIDYLNHAREEYVVIAGGTVVANINLADMFLYHAKTGADVTLAYQPHCYISSRDYRHCSFLEIMPDGRVTAVLLSHNVVTQPPMSLRIYLLRKTLLLKIVERCLVRGESSFIRDGLVRNLDSLKVYGYPVNGHAAVINSLYSYYHQSLALLEPAVWNDLFQRDRPIYTKIKDEAPTRYRPGSISRNCLVANGCTIEGQIENSILFRGVHVHPGAVVKNSVIMQKTEIGANSVVDTVICDKDVKVTAGKALKGEGNYPIIIKKGMVI